MYYAAEKTVSNIKVGFFLELMEIYGRGEMKCPSSYLKAKGRRRAVVQGSISHTQWPGNGQAH